jgi:sporadic carbohydrate cluster protein (TIGR04323 family)|tara:strand:- start:111 stop:551 length:441 start_codon:yes stop_codon:yes gene_type:complete
MTMKKVKGYNFSREFMGERAPQHVQNIVMQDFCKKNNLIFLMSVTEYAMKNSYSILNHLISNLSEIDGIILYSLFQLPEQIKQRSNILKKILKQKKLISFAVEGLTIKDIQDLKHINDIWKIKISTQKHINYDKVLKMIKQNKNYA